MPGTGRVSVHQSTFRLFRDAPSTSAGVKPSTDSPFCSRPTELLWNTLDFRRLRIEFTGTLYIHAIAQAVHIVAAREHIHIQTDDFQM